jgi:hypothetical protein
MDQLEDIIDVIPDYQVPEIDLETSAPRNILVLNRRQRTNKFQLLIAFASDALQTYLTRLVDTARQEAQNPRPTDADLDLLRRRLSDANNEANQLRTDNAALQSRITQLEIDAIQDNPLAATVARLTEQNEALTTSSTQAQSDLNSLQESTSQTITRLNGTIAEHELTITANNEALIGLQTEVDTQVNTITAHEDSIRTLNARITTLQQQISTAQEIRPLDSISDMSTDAASNPNVTSRQLYLAGIAAYYSDQTVSHIAEKFLTHDLASLPNTTRRIASCALVNLDSLPPATYNNDQQFYARYRTSMPSTTPIDGHQLPAESSFLAACINMHTRAELTQIAEQKHTSCQFGTACFIAQFNRDIVSNPNSDVAFSALMCLTNFINDTMRPKRYSVTLSRLLRMVYSTKVARTIADIASRSRSE